MARGNDETNTPQARRNTSPGPLRIRLRTGEELEVGSLGMSGYVAAPIGGMILGGRKSRDIVGKFVVGVTYSDGETGVIAQEEIAKIVDAKGKSVAYGNAKYPGHPDFDPRDGFDPENNVKKQMKEISKRKEEIMKNPKKAKEDLHKSLEETFAKYALQDKGKKKSKKKSSRKKEKKKKKAKKKKD
jgi:hypothetical protein